MSTLIDLANQLIISNKSKYYSYRNYFTYGIFDELEIKYINNPYVSMTKTDILKSYIETNYQHIARLLNPSNDCYQTYCNIILEILDKHIMNSIDKGLIFADLYLELHERLMGSNQLNETEINQMVDYMMIIVNAHTYLIYLSNYHQLLIKAEQNLNKIIKWLQHLKETVSQRVIIDNDGIEHFVIDNLIIINDPEDEYFIKIYPELFKINN